MHSPERGRRASSTLSSWVGALTLLCGSVVLTHGTAVGEERAFRKDCRIGTISVTVANTDADECLVTMQKHDPSLAYAALQEYAQSRLREMLGVSGANLLSDKGQGADLAMKLTFSIAPWNTARRGDKTSDGVCIASSTAIKWGEGAPTTVESTCGWVKRTDAEMEAAKKSIDLHIGLVLAALTTEAAKADTLMALLPEILPLSRCGEVCGKYQDGNIFDVLTDIGTKRGVELLLTVVKHRRDEVRWAAIAALAETGDASATKAVMAALGDGFWGVREAAALALLELRARDASAVKVLQDAIKKEEDDQVRQTMQRVVQQLGMGSVRVVVPPNTIDAADAVFEPGTKIVWCQGEAVLKHFGIARGLPIGIQKATFFGQDYVSLQELCTRVPELTTYQVFAEHAADQGKVYLKTRAPSAMASAAGAG